MNDILIGKIASAVQLQGSLSCEEQLGGSFHLYELPENQYQGSYVFTPSAESQTIHTGGTTLLSNITINPIPSNYGLITYNGVTITVS